MSNPAVVSERAYPRRRAKGIALAPYVVALVAGVFAFVIYWRTTAPTVLPGDSGEFQFAAWGFWLAHPTGYPLYLLLGGVWQHLFPFGDPAYRLNLFSALVSAVAVGLAYLVLDRVTRKSSTALIAALAFAFTPTFWSQATRAEVYALNILFVILISLLALALFAHYDRGVALTLTFVFGLSLTHHRTTLLLLPSLAALFAYSIHRSLRSSSFSELRMRIPVALLFAAALFAPLLLYLYIPVRAPNTPYAEIQVSPSLTLVPFGTSPSDWIALILGRRFESALAFNSSSVWSILNWAGQLVQEFNIVGALLGVFGIAALVLRHKDSLSAFVIYGCLAFAMFNSIYQIGDIRDFATPLYFFFAIGIAAGLDAVFGLLDKNPRLAVSGIPTIALLAFVAVLPMQNLFSNFAAQDQSRNYSARSLWLKLLDGGVPQNAILISNDRDEMTPLWYLQLVEGRRTDVLGLFPGITADRTTANLVTLVNKLLPQGRPVIAIKPLPSLSLHHRVTELANDMQLIDPSPFPVPKFAIQGSIGDTLAIEGYSILSGDAIARNQLTIAVRIQPLKQPDKNYRTTIQLFDSRGEKVGQGKDHVPGSPEYPPSLWQKGETIEDVILVDLSPELPSGEHGLYYVVYDEETGEQLAEPFRLGVLPVE